MERGGQHEAKASSPRTGDPKARRGREAAEPGRRHRRGLPPARDHPVDVAPLEESIRRHEGQRRQALEGTGEGEHPTQAHRGQPGPRHRHVEVRRRGKILTPNRRRRVVVALEEEFGVSERRACVVIGLDQLAHELGAPCYLRMDNGPGFVAHALVDWCRFNGAGSLFIDPGSPWQNGWIESFNARLRDEFLNGQQFDSLFEAKVLLGDWRHEYNHERTHSALRRQTPAKFAETCLFSRWIEGRKQFKWPKSVANGGLPVTPKSGD